MTEFGESEAPPQMDISWPVIAAASSDSRKATRAATSSGLMRRPIGGVSGGTIVRSGSVIMAVSVAAGATTLTVMPRVDQFLRPGPGERGQCGLRRTILALGDHTFRRAAADQHDPPAIAQARRKMIGKADGGIDMDSPEQVAGLVIEFAQLAAAHDAGGMNQRVGGFDLCDRIDAAPPCRQDRRRAA